MEVEPSDPLGMAPALALPDFDCCCGNVGSAKETRTGAPGLAAVFAYPTLEVEVKVSFEHLQF